MVSALLILAGLLIAVFLGRRLLADRVLVWLLVVSHAVKVALALGFYYVSLWRLPILAEIQRGDGFWTFSRDSFNYHTWGLQIIDAWRLGISLPPMGGEHPMHLYAAALYTVLGSHPLHAVLLNAWYSTFSIVLAVLLVRRFTDQVSTARIVAFLVAFWPSLILWSTQLTKDPLVIFLLLAELYVIVTLWQPLPESPPRRAGRWVAAAFLPFLIHYLRTCVGLMLMVSVVMVFFPVAMFRAVRGEVRQMEELWP